MSEQLPGRVRPDPPAALGTGVGLAVAAGGLTLAAGWVDSVAGLVRTRPGPATVAFNATLALAALGAAIALLCARPPGRRPLALRWSAGLAGGGAALVAAASLVEDLTGRSLGIDQLFLHDRWSAAGPPGRIAPELSVLLVLVGVAVALESWRPRLARIVAWTGAAATAVVVVAATELAGSSEQIFGLTGVARVGLPAVLFGALIAVGLQIAIADRAGAVRALWVESSLRASMLRMFVLPLPVIAIGPLCLTTVLANRSHPGSGRIVAELGTATVAAMVAAGAVAGSRAAARMVGQLEAMDAGAARIEAGTLDVPVAVDDAAPDEFGQLARAFDRMRAHLAAQGRIERLVRQATAAASAAPDLASAFDAFAERVSAEVPFDRASYVRPVSGGGFEVVAVHGRASLRLPVGTVSPISSRLQRRFEAMEVVVDNDLGVMPAPESIYRLLRQRGMRSTVTVPVVAGGHVRALFNFSSAEPGAFDPDRVGLLEAVVRESTAVFGMLVGLDRERQAVERLEEIDRLKDQFVFMVAHDLRSPMGVISGYADTLRLRWDVLTPGQREEFLATISRSVLVLSAMVEDMLQVAQIESGEYSFEVVPFRIDSLVRRTTAEITALFEARPATVAVADDLPLALGDEQRMWQVLTNLLSNACKFSHPGDLLTVEVRPDGNHIRVEVTDRGPGIAADDHARIFDKFTRLPAEPGNRQSKGTGLGLYICRRLVEGQGGRIGVRSAPGSGATFWFTLPAAPAANGAGSARPASRAGRA